MKPLVAAASVCAFVLLGLAAAPEARADGGSGMCRSGHLALLGERTFQVFRNCGQPAWAQQYGSAYRRVEEWVYDPGSGSYLRVLTFVNGVLVRIEEVPPGH
jgi:hypothetical protein